MQQAMPRRVYGITKVQYAEMVAAVQAPQRARAREGLFARLKKRFG